MSRIIANILLILIIAFTVSAVPINPDILDLDIQIPQADITEIQEQEADITKDPPEIAPLTYVASPSTYLYNPDTYVINFSGLQDAASIDISDLISTFEIDLYTMQGSDTSRIAKRIRDEALLELCTHSRKNDTLSVEVDLSKDGLGIENGHYSIEITSKSEYLSSPLETVINASYYTTEMSYNGTKAAPPRGKRIMTLYFTDSDNKYLVPVSKEISYTGNLIRTTLNALRDGPDADSGLNLKSPAPYIPAARFSTQTEVVRLETNSYENSSYTTDEDDTYLMMHSLINTMTHIPNVSYVKFSVDQSDNQPLNGFDLRKTYPRPEGAMAHLGLLTQTQHMYLVPISVDALDAESMFRVLQNGTEQSTGLFSPIPPEVDLVSSKLEDGILTLTLDDSVTRVYKGNEQMGTFMVDSIIQSMATLPGVESIVLKTQSSAEETLFSHPLNTAFEAEYYINMAD